MHRILWMKGGALGDFIVGLPVLAALRRAWPHAALEAVGPASWLALASDWADHGARIDAPEWASLYDDGRTLPARLADVDLAVVLRPDPEGLAARNLTRAGIAQVLVRSPIPDGSMHIVDQLRQVLGPLGIESEPRPVIRVPPQAPHPTQVLLHPGSGGAGKRWASERFLEIAVRLAERGFHPMVVLGPVELERDEARFWSGAPVTLLKAPHLPKLAEALARARLFVGNDSGVGHLAAAVGCPTLSLFGPSDPAVWAPRGPVVRVIVAEPERFLSRASNLYSPLEALPVETVWAAIDGMLAPLPRTES